MIQEAIAAVTAVGKATDAALELAEKRTELNNQADVKAAAVAKAEDEERAKDIEAVQNRNIEEVRKRCAE
jgi:hypothetical protein